MKTKDKFFFCHQFHPFRAASLVSVTLLFGAVVSSAQSSIYLYTGAEKTITLTAGAYDITAYGAQGGNGYFAAGGLGAEMEAQFIFASAVNIEILVGGAGVNAYYSAGGGGGTFVVEGTAPLVIAGGGGGGSAWGGAYGLVGTSGGAGMNGGNGGSGGSGGFAGGGGGGGGYSGNGGNGTGGGGRSFLNGGGGGGGGGLDTGSGGYGGGGGGGGSSGGGLGGGGGGGGYSGGGGGATLYGGGGGSYIDSSAVGILAEVSGIASPNDGFNGEIIITEVPEPTSLVLAGLGGLSLVLSHCQRK